jgi:hypothetical protein
MLPLPQALATPVRYLAALCCFCSSASAQGRDGTLANPHDVPSIPTPWAAAGVTSGMVLDHSVGLYGLRLTASEQLTVDSVPRRGFAPPLPPPRGVPSLPDRSREIAPRRPLSAREEHIAMSMVFGGTLGGLAGLVYGVRRLVRHHEEVRVPFAEPVYLVMYMAQGAGVGFAAGAGVGVITLPLAEVLPPRRRPVEGHA